MKKLLIPLLMFLLLTVTVHAEPTTVTMPVSGGMTVRTADVDLTGAEEAWIRHAFGLTTDTARSSLATLTEDEQLLYNYLEAEVEKIATGERASTEIVVPWTLFDVPEKVYPEDLGMDTFWLEDGSNFDWNTIVESYEKIYTPDCDEQKVMSALMLDKPERFFWSSNVYNPAYGYYYDYNYEGDGVYSITADYKYYCVYYVSAAYAPDDATEEYITEVDTAKTGIFGTAAANAKELINKCSGYADYNKIKGYVEGIRELSDYNWDAAGEDWDSMANTNPWQLVYVFDGDPDTKVVCEGYSKAFKYLVDQTAFADKSLKIKCYCVTGDLYSMYDGEGGGHMWNILSTTAGNFLVDVTNYYAPDYDFSASGYGAVPTYAEQYDGYLIGDLLYIYDNYTLKLYTDGVLSYCQHENTDIIEGTPATATATGLSEGLWCKDCETWIVEQWVIPITATRDVFTLPKDLKTLGASALRGTSPVRVVIPANIETIEANALRDCGDLTQVQILNGSLQLNEAALNGLDADEVVFYAPKGSDVAEWLENEGWHVVEE